ncbi:MAG: sterol desaturase family protein [Solirubrobacterales bacterium]|nr:sterol desaturase family protein [Solirubrobacterales bacterium]
MIDLIKTAIPFFIALVLIEVLVHHFDPDDDQTGYEPRDTATSLTMGLGNVLINIFWKLVLIAVLAATYRLSPLRMPMDDVWPWVVLLLSEDFLFYWWHRTSHEVRLFWANHVIHHSSQHFNLSTALRQDWLPMFSLPFWIPLALIGFPPWAIILQQAISLLFQFGLHTERIGKLPRPIEYFFNTPSHHRVHHGANTGYLDRNYGGILIIWDRIFGTLREEDDKVVYGLTKNVDSFNPLRVASHEWSDMVADVRSAPNMRTKLGYVFRGPGWKPSEQTAASATEPAAGLNARSGGSVEKAVDDLPSRGSRRSPGEHAKVTAGSGLKRD